jgi:hypothetical protein
MSKHLVDDGFQDVAMGMHLYRVKKNHLRVPTFILFTWPGLKEGEQITQ